MRLTKWSEKEGWIIPVCDENGRKITLEEVCNRLAAYENTELEPEDIAAPALWIGQTLYWIPVPEARNVWDNRKPYKSTVESITIGKKETTVWVMGESGTAWPVLAEHIGKQAFFTEEEAKRAWESMQC